MDRPTGRVVRRIETSRCGELVHIDVKKLARIPDGRGHKKLAHHRIETETQKQSRLWGPNIRSWVLTRENVDRP